MIKIKIDQLLNSTDGLKNLSQKTLKARPAYMVGRLLKAADAEISTFNDARMKLIEKYCDKDENGNLKKDEDDNVHIPDQSLEAFNTELQELLDTVVEINANKIKIEDINDIDFTPNEMAQLDEFIEIDI